MQINEILVQEMTMTMSDLGPRMTDIATQYTNKWATGEHVGDIEDNFKILKTDNVYSLWDGNNMIAYVSVTPSDFKDAVEVNYWTSPNYRRQRVISKLLWFLKTRENFSKMILGTHHSSDTIKMLRSGGLSHFVKSWVNLKTGDQVPYNKTNDIAQDGSYMPYRSVTERTDWRLIIENTGDFSDYPRFNKDTHPVDIRMMYSGFTDEEDE